MFDPKTSRYPYPEVTDQHYLKVKKNNGVVFDADYPYIDRSFSFRFVDFWIRILLYTIVFPATRIRLGLHVEGKENLKKYQDVINKGVVSCCNHVHMWDYLGIMRTIRPRKPYLLTWAPNVNGENGKLIRHVGGIPIPESGKSATQAYMRTVSGILHDGGWLHIYSEGSMWEYYAPIRPFKRGAFYFACKNNKPVIPLAYSYRKPSAIRKKLFGQLACFTLHVGEPLYPDVSLPNKKQQIDLTERCHAAVCRLAGIEPDENVYPPVYKNDRRVDYYTDTYGVGYKGSW